jgi:hypothetical protein
MRKFYAIMTKDKPGASVTRMAKLKEHLAHVEESLNDFAIAGPLRDEEGNFTGSLLVVRAESEEQARAMLAKDPYFQADIWSEIEIRAFSAAVGDWVGGKAW